MQLPRLEGDRVECNFSWFIKSITAMSNQNENKTKQKEKNGKKSVAIIAISKHIHMKLISDVIIH